MSLFSKNRIKGKDERLSAQLGEIYKVGFYVMAFGILFDVYTRFNYLAQLENDKTFALSNSIEIGVLIAAALIVGTMMIRRGVCSDSLRYTEARTFSETGMVVPTLLIALVPAIAAVSGRIYYEVVFFGWSEVTWLGDIAMLVILFMQFAVICILAQYAMWRSYRKNEDRLMQEED